MQCFKWYLQYPPTRIKQILLGKNSIFPVGVIFRSILIHLLRLYSCDSTTNTTCDFSGHRFDLIHNYKYYKLDRNAVVVSAAKLKLYREKS